MKPALGMPAMPPVPSRTTLVKFFNLDVDLGFLFFSKLDPYKTPEIVSFKDDLPFLFSCKKNLVFEKFFGQTFFIFFKVKMVSSKHVLPLYD